MFDKPKGNVTTIKEFFERKDQCAPEGGRKVSMDEFKALSNQERADLGNLCGVALGYVKVEGGWQEAS